MLSRECGGGEGGRGFSGGEDGSGVQAANERFYLRQIRGYTHLRSSGDPGPPQPARRSPAHSHRPRSGFLLKDHPRATFSSVSYSSRSTQSAEHSLATPREPLHAAHNPPRSGIAPNHDERYRAVTYRSTENPKPIVHLSKSVCKGTNCDGVGPAVRTNRVRAVQRSARALMPPSSHPPRKQQQQHSPPSQAQAQAPVPA